VSINNRNAGDNFLDKKLDSGGDTILTIFVRIKPSPFAGEGLGEGEYPLTLTLSLGEREL